MRGLVAGAAVLFLAALALGDPSSFVEVDEEFHRRNRELLQDYENPDDVEVGDGGGGEDEQEEEERRIQEPAYSTEPCKFMTLKSTVRVRMTFKFKRIILPMQAIPDFQPTDPPCFTTTAGTSSWR